MIINGLDIDMGLGYNKDIDIYIYKLYYMFVDRHRLDYGKRHRPYCIYIDIDTIVIDGGYNLKTIRNIQAAPVYPHVYPPIFPLETQIVHIYIYIIASIYIYIIVYIYIYIYSTAYIFYEKSNLMRKSFFGTIGGRLDRKIL